MMPVHRGFLPSLTGLASMILLTACAAVSAPAEAQERPADPAASASAANALEYPQADRVWSHIEYGAVEEAVAAGRAGLPTMAQGEAGGAVFARMVDVGNLEPFRDAAAPLSSRLPAFLELVGPVNALFRRYISAGSAGQQLDRELTRYQAFIVAVGGVGLDLLAEYKPSDPPELAIESSMRGAAQMREGSRNVWLRSMQYLAASQTTDREALVDLVGALDRHATSYARVLKPDDIAVSLRRIEGLQQGITDARIKGDLASLASKVGRTEPAAR